MRAAAVRVGVSPREMHHPRYDAGTKWNWRGVGDDVTLRTEPDPSGMSCARRRHVRNEDWQEFVSATGGLTSDGLRVAADVGGTFTDVAMLSGETGELRLGKVLTTPARLVDGMHGALDDAGGSFADTALFLHGTTIAINTLLERTGARCALLTTRGFRDIYEIGRINRPESYNLFFRKHQPLIRRAMRFEVDERVDWRGRVLIPLDEAQLLAAAAE